MLILFKKQNMSEIIVNMAMIISKIKCYNKYGVEIWEN